tara:strand:+ start:2882 stop:3031 length:150 start_codon:yes stop_codon:yes gene_type:complete
LSQALQKRCERSGKKDESDETMKGLKEGRKKGREEGRKEGNGYKKVGTS